MKHCIYKIIDQYCLAVGNCDMEHFECQMTSGRMKTFLDGDKEIEDYIEDKFAYWKKKGWEFIEEKGNKILRPVKS